MTWLIVLLFSVGFVVVLLIARSEQRNGQPLFLDCDGPCRKLHGPHARHDDGRVTCCLCGGVHLSSIPQQRGPSDG